MNPLRWIGRKLARYLSESRGPGHVMTHHPERLAATLKKGDVLLMVVHKGQQTELRSVEQFNRLLAGLDKNAVITLQVRRGESTAFVTVAGLTDKG